MNRNILLIEPNYLNKYPPIGLMKIATYHRHLGDRVRFFKGDLRDFVLDHLLETCLEKLGQIDTSANWKLKQALVRQFIQSKKTELFEEIGTATSPFQLLLENCLLVFADAFKKKNWQPYIQFDRVYVATMFTFYWKITVETIEFCKQLVQNPQADLLVGGVLATLLHEELEKATGIRPLKGLLDQPGQLDPALPEAQHIIIDNLPLDYSILDEIEYEYPTRSAYFTFMTKGCTRKCAFCSVPVLEPTYKPKIETFDKFQEIKARFGEQQNLLLMDNNVLASPKFLEIIDEIKAMGFVNGATYVEPNQLEIAIQNLREGYNDRAFVRRSFRLIHALLKRLKGKSAKDFYDALARHELLKFETTTKENLLAAYPEIADIYERLRPKSPRQRFVDFNQGTDCRYVTEEIMQKMSEIPIRPLRIAFDYIGLRPQYEAAVRLAAKYGIRDLSNYILYNFHDKPEDLWHRLKINVDLCKELGIEIYSFPMKYIPLFGEDAKHREFTGKHWNKKFIRAVQSVLNVTKGIVAPAKRKETIEDSFFHKAFGKSLGEFFEILWMPETFIVYRFLFEREGYTELWRKAFYSLEAHEMEEAKRIISFSEFSNLASKTSNPRILHLLNFYTVHRNQVGNGKDEQFQKLKTRFDRLIREDQFVELTLTYDFEKEMPAGVAAVY